MTSSGASDITIWPTPSSMRMSVFASFSTKALAPFAGVLLLQGTVDRMTPAKGAKAFVEKLAKTDIRMLDGVGHMVMSEAPNDVTAALRDFIR